MFETINLTFLEDEPFIILQCVYKRIGYEEHIATHHRRTQYSSDSISTYLRFYIIYRRYYPTLFRKAISHLLITEFYKVTLRYTQLEVSQF